MATYTVSKTFERARSVSVTGMEAHWINPENALTPDDSAVAWSTVNQLTDNLVLDQPSGDDVPSDGTIIKIELLYSAYSTQPNMFVYNLQLQKSGVPTGDDHGGVKIPSPDAPAGYVVVDGGLWGTTWTPAEANALGMQIMVHNATDLDVPVYVRHIYARITYSVPDPDQPDGDGDTTMANYATTTDLANYLDCDLSALPAEANRLLARATALINRMTLGRIDTTLDSHAAAAKEAACAQVEYWIDNNEETEFEGPVRSRTAGKTLTVYAGQGNPRLAPRAKDALLLAGLLYAGVG